MFTGEDSASPPPSLAPSGSCPPPRAARSSGRYSTPPGQTHRPATGCASLNPCSRSSSGLLPQESRRELIHIFAPVTHNRRRVEPERGRHDRSTLNIYLEGTS